MRPETEHRSWDDIAAQQAYDDHLRRIRSRSTKDGREPRPAGKVPGTALLALIGLLVAASVTQLLVVGPVARMIETAPSIVLADGMSPVRPSLLGGVCVAIGLALVSLGWFGRWTDVSFMKTRGFVRAGVIYLGLHFAAYGAFVSFVDWLP